MNSHVGHFERARDALAAFPDWFVDDFLTGVFPPEEIEAAFEADQQKIKAVVDFKT